MIAEYSIFENKFIPNDEDDKLHIAYDDHSYVIPQEIIDNAESNTLNEEYFF